ncbi:MAG: YfhO family protein [Streptococcus sp.]|nr:YfhO family protein [Streptococcus sp.]
MKRKIKKLLFPSLSFCIPIVIFTIVLAIYGIYFGSDKTILASDGFHQYVIFAQTLRDILHGRDSLFYTFTSGLGLNFYALMSYYLGSFLTPLYYFFDLQSMPDAIYLITILKIGLISLSANTCFTRMYKKVDKLWVLILSVYYSLMSFLISQLEINMWLDAFIMFPVILLGLQRLIKSSKAILYYISLTILFIQNYYFGYMFSLFLVIYFPVYIVNIKGLKNKIGLLLRFCIVSILSVLSSGVMLLPTFLDLQTQGEKLTKLTSLLTEKSWYLDFFAKNLVGVYDTTKFGSIPTLYIGLPILVLSLLYFTIKGIKTRYKLAYLFPIVTLFLSFYLEPLDLFWQGMHAPNMFLHRYSWSISLIMLLLSFETLSYFKKIVVRQIVLVYTILTLGFIVTLIFRGHYDFIENINIILTFSFLLAYALLMICYKSNYIKKSFMFSFFIIFSMFELFLNTYYQVGKLENEWVFPSRDAYQKSLNEIKSLVTETSKEESDFYRLERVVGETGNDSMKFGYYGISQFSSIRNRNSSHLLDRLGYKSTGTNLNLRYQNNTILMDSLFSIKYNLSQGEINKYGFSLKNIKNNTRLYKNNNTLPLGILGHEVYKDIDVTVNTLDNQTRILNQLSGLNQIYFYRTSYKIDSKFTQFGNNIILKADKNSEIHFQMLSNRSGEFYISVPNIKFNNDQSKNIEMIINQKNHHYTVDDAYSFFDLGYFEKGDTIDVTMIFPNNREISFNKPNVYTLDKYAYDKVINRLKGKAVTSKTAGNKVFLNYDSQKRTSLIVTLPFDRGWIAEINGKKIQVKKFQNGLIKLNVPKGKHQIILKFIPYGFKLGCIISLLGLLLFVVYLKIDRKKNKTHC